MTSTTVFTFSSFRTVSPKFIIRISAEGHTLLRSLTVQIILNYFHDIKYHWLLADTIIFLWCFIRFLMHVLRWLGDCFFLSCKWDPFIIVIVVVVILRWFFCSHILWFFLSQIQKGFLLFISNYVGEVSMNPYLNFSILIDENLLFRDTKIAKMLHQYLESLKANPEHVQGIEEGDIIDLS